MEIARCFTKDDNHCVIAVRGGDRLNESKDEFEADYGVTVKVLTKDLTSASACEEIYEQLDEQGVFVHSLVNNAGFANYGAVAVHGWLNSIWSSLVRYAPPFAGSPDCRSRAGRILRQMTHQCRHYRLPN